MEQRTIAVLEECVALSLGGRAPFPTIIQKLVAIGVERYHTDYCRRETTYYLASGDSHVIPMRYPPTPIADVFSAAGVEAAVRKSQRGEITYVDFLRLSSDVGCVGYFVQIAGKRVLYFGRLGDTHVEHFPPAPTP